jgi:hypothetical protein
LSDHEIEHIEEPPPEEEIKAPFTFKLMIALVVLYLGWRLVQGIMWVIERLSS